MEKLIKGNSGRVLFTVQIEEEICLRKGRGSGSLLKATKEPGGDISGGGGEASTISGKKGEYRKASDSLVQKKRASTKKKEASPTPERESSFSLKRRGGFQPMKRGGPSAKKKTQKKRKKKERYGSSFQPPIVT